MNPFDRLQENTHKTIASYFGEPATWTPSTVEGILPGQPDGIPTAVRVLFKDPSHEMQLGGFTFEPDATVAEYYSNELLGLKERADQGIPEQLIINGETYDVRQVLKKYDGKTCLAILHKSKAA